MAARDAQRIRSEAPEAHAAHAQWPSHGSRLAPAATALRLPAQPVRGGPEPERRASSSRAPSVSAPLHKQTAVSSFASLIFICNSILLILIPSPTPTSKVSIDAITAAQAPHCQEATSPLRPPRKSRTRGTFSTGMYKGTHEGDQEPHAFYLHHLDRIWRWSTSALQRNEVAMGVSLFDCGRKWTWGHVRGRHRDGHAHELRSGTVSWRIDDVVGVGMWHLARHAFTRRPHGRRLSRATTPSTTVHTMLAGWALAVGPGNGFAGSCESVYHCATTPILTLLRTLYTLAYPAPTVKMGKPRGLNTARKLRSDRRDNKWVSIRDGVRRCRRLVAVVNLLLTTPPTTRFTSPTTGRRPLQQAHAWQLLQVVPHWWLLAGQGYRA